MTWLLVKVRKSYVLYSPDTYGMQTWGSSDQESIVKKKKYWYYTEWRAGLYEDSDDYNFKYKLNVVCESTNITDIMRYLYTNNVSKETKLEILESAQNIFNDFIKFEKWSAN